MVDGEWHNHDMEEGANQGCLFFSTLAVAALVLNKILRPLHEKLLARADNRLHIEQRPMEDGVGEESHPMGYVDDSGCAVPHEDVLFFMREFERLLGRIRINLQKTRIMTSTNGESALGAIDLEYGKVTVDRVKMAIETNSDKNENGGDTMLGAVKWYVDESNFEPSERANLQVAESNATQEPTRPVDIADDLKLLGQPLGSPAFSRQFFE